MAEPEEPEKPEKPEPQEDRPEDLFEEEKSGGGGLNVKLLVRVGLMAVVAAAGSLGGYAVGALFHGAAPVDANQPAGAQPVIEAPVAAGDLANEDFEYFDFERITVNLNEPRLARYIAATITIAYKRADSSAASDMVTKKQKEMRNWLTVYLAGLTLDDVRGPKNLNRIRREIQDSFNEQLWPNKRPLIDHVLFKEFAVQ